MSPAPALVFAGGVTASKTETDFPQRGRRSLRRSDGLSTCWGFFRTAPIIAASGASSVACAHRHASARAGPRVSG